MAAGRSPVIAGRRSRRGRGWSPTPKKPPPSAPSPPAREPAALSRGAEVEVRVDDDDFHGSWFEGVVEGLAPARGRSSARCTVAYAHLTADDGGPLVEPFAPTHIRPRPPACSSTPPRFLLHDVVEAFDRGGWWSGIVVEAAAADPAPSVTVAFPITREVIAFPPHLVRPRRDYVAGEWVPSRAVIAVQPKRAFKVYEVGDKVEVGKERKVYGYSWFPATVAKGIDHLSYIVEYSDQEEEGGEKATEYLHSQFIRPAVEHSPREDEFQLMLGATVEAYCDGAWSPGVVCRVVGDGEYEVRINGKGKKHLVTKVVELLKPQYSWDGNRWSIVKPKRQAKLRRQSASGKRLISTVEVPLGEDGRSHEAEYSGTKKSRKELQQEVVAFAESSKHASVSKMDTPSSASNHSPIAGSLLPGNSKLPDESIPNVGERGINQQIKSSIMVLSKNNEKTHPMEALQGKNDASDNEQIQLKENKYISSKEISCALSASSHSQATSVLTKEVSMWANSGSNLKVYMSRKSATNKIFRGPNSPQSKLNPTQRGEKKAAGRMKQPSLEQLDRILEDKLSTNEVINQELLSMVSQGSGSLRNGKGTNLHGSLLEKGLAATTSSMCQADKNPDVLRDSAATPVDQNNHPMETHTLSLGRLVQQNRENIDERSTVIGSHNVVSSHCINENSMLSSCSVAGRSVPSDLAVSKISGHEALFVKRSPAWSYIDQMDVFKEAPQQPHFLPLQQQNSESREMTALGLTLEFATLVENVRKSSIEDSIASFEEKIHTLRYLEDNGFNVKSLRCSLTKLSEIKSNYTKILKEKEEVEPQILEKSAYLSRIDSLLDVENKAIAEHEKKIRQHRCAAKQIAKEKEHEGAELKRLQAANSSIEDRCGDAKRQFQGIMVELQQGHLT
ncbi:hypothetical protein ACP70R_008269 [Stipagrostis hirtigluma subsp. patula]